MAITVSLQAALDVVVPEVRGIPWVSWPRLGPVYVTDPEGIGESCWHATNTRVDNGDQTVI